MNPKVFEASLAGLVHNIGVVARHGSDDSPSTNDGKELAAWTIDFIREHIVKRYRSIALSAGYTHNPEEAPRGQENLARMVGLADRLSTGQWVDVDGDDEAMQLVSIFDQIALPDGERVDRSHVLPLGLLALQEELLFPTEPWEREKCRGAYQRSLETLARVLEDDPGDEATYLENVLSALQRATFQIPSAQADVSHYDQTRMTAAIAACLTDFETDEIKTITEAVEKSFSNDQDQDKKRSKQMGQDIALLIGGDISGVQDFIYSITSKRAAKTLRGRSFYLQLLTEAVLRFVLERLGLPYSNVIYAGGGHFFLLAPLSKAVELEQVQREVSEKMLKYHGTRLYLAVGSTKVTVGDFKIGRFSACWQRMHQDMNKTKRRRYQELGDDIYPRVFDPPSHGGNTEETCSVCGEERKGTREYEQDDVRVCPLCDSFSGEFGQKIPTNKFIALGFGPERAESGETALDVLASFGMVVTWPDRTNKVSFGDDTKIDRVVVWALDDAKPEEFPPSAKWPSVNRMQYTVSLIPSEKNQPLTFDQLQKESSGLHRLGVLRMDVDNLGDVFSKGLGERVTLARLSTLSFRMSLFFEGWIERICQREPFKGLIYAVYAGGDDVFLIGPWDLMPKLAATISKEFNIYTGKHPDLHISGGMSFIHGKYPVYQAAEDAGEAEDQAKDFPGKNAFSLLGRPLAWDQFEELLDDYKKLLYLVGEEEKEDEKSIEAEIGRKPLGGPHALLQTLYELAEEKEKHQKRDGRLEWGPWIWHGVDRLVRMEKRHKEDKAFAAGVKEIRKDVTKIEINNPKDIDYWGLAARWAQLRLRKPQEGDDSND
jgi:CRISPR-associated protein Csm1